MVECLQTMKDMQDAGAMDVIAGGQPDNEEAYPLYNSGDVAAAIHAILADQPLLKLHDRPFR